MKKLGTLLMLIAIIAVAAPTFAQGGVQQIEPATAPIAIYGGDVVDETPTMWFVEFAGQPTVEGGDPVLLQKEKDSFRKAAKRVGLDYTERYAFGTLWNGLSIEIAEGQFARLAGMAGIKALYPVLPVSLPEPKGGEELDLYTALAMTGADIAQSELGYTGAGIKVAVMDTGIDYDHPDLGGCFGDGCRVAYGYDLVGDAFNADPTSPSYNPIPVPDDDPDDCQGHGTHVAGIVGADGTITGVAPGVTFGAYRVFGCEGSTLSDIMVAAMELAHKDHMDILNMSIGSSFQWPQYPTAVASDRLVKRGMVVVASIGNSGTSGTYAAGAPGVGEKVIGTASFDNTNAMSPYFEVAGEKIGYIQMSYADPAPTAGTEEIVYIGLACNGYALEADPAGKVALISRGDCSFYDKAANALAAGATAAVMHNNAPGNFSGTLGTYLPIPAVGISMEDGMFIRGQAAPIMMTWTDQLYSFPNPTGGLISSFSSYGLAPDLSLKPDIGAPGGSIYSTIPLEQGGYGTKGGTSMASPHVAGAAALLLEAKPKTAPEEVRDILQNNADPKDWNLAPGYGYLEPVHRQGAGMVDIDGAILATTKITPAKLALGESEAGPVEFKLTVANDGPDDVIYHLDYAAGVIGTTGTWADDLDFWLTDEVVDFQPATLMVKAGQQRDVRVTITPPTGPDLGTYGGYIVLTPDDGGEPYHVPYAGFVGDYQALSVLDANPYGLPWFWESIDGDMVYTMEGADIPEIWVNLGHQVEWFGLEAVDANTGKSVFWVDQDEYVGRNSNYNSIFSWTWDGTTTPGKSGKRVFTAPDGDYVLVFKVLKALGDKNNPDHWETWTSPEFTIDRP